MALYNSSNLTILNTDYDIVVTGPFETSISSTYQKGSPSMAVRVPLLLTYIVVILIPGVFINMKFLNNIKHEQRKEQGKILHRIMKTHSMAQMIVWPSFLLLRWITKADEHIILLLHPCFHHYFGTILRFAYAAFRLYIGFNSVVVAICRICFIVYDHKISNYGIDKFKKIIYSGSILLPLGVAILAEGTVLPPIYAIGVPPFLKCTGANATVNDTQIENQSPIYAFVQNHVSSYITISIKVVCYTMIFIILSNTIEGIIYWYTWRWIKR